jgi:hypothetical protein
LTYWVLVLYFLVVLALRFFESLTGMRGIVGQLLEPVYRGARRSGARIKEIPKKIGNMRLNARKDGSKKTGTEEKKRGLGFFLLLAVTLWFTGFFAWSQTVIWQSVLSDISHSSSISGIETIAAEGIVETLIVSALFGFYLWLAYGLSSAYREVFEGLFGLRNRKDETPKP